MSYPPPQQPPEAFQQPAPGIYVQPASAPVAAYPPQPVMVAGAPPPSYGVAPAPVVVQVAPAAPIRFTEIPVATQCQHCHNNITTMVHYQTGTFTWVLSGGICFFGGCIFCLCLIPFCVDAAKDAIHTCPQCKKVVGKYNRM